MPTADVSVRPAVPGDEDAITAIQLASWADAYGAAVVDALPIENMRATWEASIAAPPSRAHRVFTACDGPRVVGFAATTPAGDVIALEVAPAERRHGHGSRLLAACADTLLAAGGSQIRAWAAEGDDARAAFYAQAGLAEGGVRRTLAGPAGELREVMYRAALAS